MLKKAITFEDLDGNSVTEDFYFNLTKAELVELELTTENGFADTLKAIVASEDKALIVEHFKKIILMSYGERAADGRGFTKNDELKDAFASTDAYSELFVELATQTDKAVEFINGIVPTGMAQGQVLDLQTGESTPPATDVELPDPIATPDKGSWSSFTKQQLLAMSDQEFNTAAGTTKPQDMAHELLLVAMERKNKQ